MSSDFDPLFKEIVLPSLLRSSSSFSVNAVLLHQLHAQGLLRAEERDELEKISKKQPNEVVLRKLIGETLPSHGVGTFDRFVSAAGSNPIIRNNTEKWKDQKSAGTAKIAKKLTDSGERLGDILKDDSDVRLRLKADSDFGQLAVMNPTLCNYFAKNPLIAEECGVQPKIAKLFENAPELRNALEKDKDVEKLFFANPSIGNILTDLPQLGSLFVRLPKIAKSVAFDRDLARKLALDPDEERRLATAIYVVKYSNSYEGGKALAEKHIIERGRKAEDASLGAPEIGKELAMFMTKENLAKTQGAGDQPSYDNMKSVFGVLAKKAKEHAHDPASVKEGEKPEGVEAFKAGSAATELLSRDPTLLEAFYKDRNIVKQVQGIFALAKEGDVEQLGDAIQKLVYDGIRKVADTPDIAGALFTRVRAKKAFDKAKEEGGLVTVVRARIHLVGKDGAGKTCVKNALLSQEFVENQPSTPGIATDVAVCQAETANEDGAWVVPEAGQAPQLIATALRGRMVGPSLPATSEQEDDEDKERSATKSEMKKPKSQISAKAKRVSSAVTETAEVDVAGASASTIEPSFESFAAVPFEKDQGDIARSFGESDTLQAAYQKMATVGPDEPIYSSITIWDEGGQEQYLNMQTPFIAEDAIHLLVFDLTQDPDKEIDVTRYRFRDGTAISQPSFGFKTYGRVLLHWLSMLVVSEGKSQNALSKFFDKEITSSALIRAIGGAFRPKVASPPCILLGTRAKFPDALKSRYQSYLKRLFEDHSRARLLDHIIESDQDSGTSSNEKDPFLYFPVECNHASKEEKEAAKDANAAYPQDPLFAQIRRKIIAAARRYWKERKLPKRWLILQLLNEFVSKNNAIVHAKYLYPIAQKSCGISDEEEFHYALIYLDALGMIIFKPGSNYQVLNEYIVTDPTWLFEVFSRFLPMISQETGRSSIVEGEELYEQYKSDLVEVQTKGKMCPRLVQYFLKNIGRAEKFGDQIMKLLQDFDVLAPCANQESEKGAFFVPCLVQTRLEDTKKCFINQEEGREKYTTPLVLKAGRILIWPEPLFFRLVTRFLNIYQPRKVICERHRVVINDIDPSNHSISLEFVYLEPTYVAATVRYRDLKDGAKFVREKCRELRKSILENLDHIKMLGFQGFEFFTCITRTPRSLPVPAKEGDDLYIDLDANLSFHSNGDVYFRGDSDKELLDEDLCKELSFWYGESKAKEEEDDYSADELGDKFPPRSKEM